MKLFRRWIRILHRDLGYFFVAMTIIYSLSGIAINHLRDWNPNYQINIIEFTSPLPSNPQLSDVKIMLKKLGQEKNYKKHYSKNKDNVKVFLKSGSIEINTQTHKGTFEKLEKRWLFHQINYLHLNPFRAWTFFSDFFAGVLIFLAISGLVMVKGKNGFFWRGAILFFIGIIIPVLLFMFSAS
ncbi:MAG: PepSY-associated TM helix domain-containing protein [Bacteroidales bacterium]